MASYSTADRLPPAASAARGGPERLARLAGRAHPVVVRTVRDLRRGGEGFAGRRGQVEARPQLAQLDARELVADGDGDVAAVALAVGLDEIRRVALERLAFGDATEAHQDLHAPTTRLRFVLDARRAHPFGGTIRNAVAQGHVAELVT